MCYVSHREAVEEEVRMCVRRRERFTAYTITCALRERGFREPHMVLKEVVHCLFRYGRMSKTYQRSFVRLENGCEAFLFHHRSDSVADYESDKQIKIGGLTRSMQRESCANRFAVARIPISVRKEDW